MVRIRTGSKAMTRKEALPFLAPVGTRPPRKHDPGAVRMAPPRKPRRLTPLFLAAPAAILVALPMPAHTAPLPEAAAAADPADQQLTIDLAEPTGDFHGGASGLLYGLYGPGLPSDNLIEEIGRASCRERVARRVGAGGRHK